jgi:hypothetical protein
VREEARIENQINIFTIKIESGNQKFLKYALYENRLSVKHGNIL